VGSIFLALQCRIAGKRGARKRTPRDVASRALAPIVGGAGLGYLRRSSVGLAFLAGSPRRVTELDGGPLEDPAVQERHDADHRLAERTLAGEPGALEELIDRLRCVARILAVLNARTGGMLDEHELADLTQDVVIVLWTKLDTYTNASRLETWSYGVARHVFMNALRKKVRGVLRFERIQHGPREEPAGAAPAPELDGTELLAILDVLPDTEARAIRMKVLENLTFEAIGERERTSANTIKARYYRGIQKLHAKLGGREEGV
jgi:RNA polymerase sigma-70 factor (ECF subfamily)